MTTKLSVNLNKVALIRNSRGENLPNLLQFALDCEAYGADGITVHPRPDERHIRYSDIPILKKNIHTELNIEGYPSESFLRLVEENMPAQCTLVPDPPEALTSSEGWNTLTHASFLKEISDRLHQKGIRVSLFLDPAEKFVEGAQKTNCDRIELYTGKYAKEYATNPASAVKAHTASANLAAQLGIGLNAGHDLNLLNLKYYHQHVSNLLEVSIGHAIISDALYYGIQNTIGMYKVLI